MSRPNEGRAGGRPLVLLTGPITGAAQSRIGAVAQVRLVPDARPDTLRREAADADLLVVRSALPDDLLDHAPRLRGIVRHGVGTDMIPVATATARGVPVANVPGSNRDAVAEQVLASLHLLARHTHRMDAALRRQGWAASRALSDHAREIGGRTLGLVGVGSIGLRVAEIGHHGFGMRVLGHQRQLHTLPPFVTGVPLDELLARADFVVLCCPLNASTRHLLDARRLALMRPGALLVNVSRGEVVDEAALLAALRDGPLGGAALDVFTHQPLPADHPLLGLDNVLLTPHAAGLTEQSMQRMSEGTADEVLRLLRGERPLNLVNPEVWPDHPPPA